MSPQPPNKYILDSCVLIDAYKEHYSPDICPGFWNAIGHHQAQSVLSIDHVRKELSAGNDDDGLKIWAKHTSLDSFFQSTATAGVAAAYTQVMTWVQALADKKPYDKAHFANGADGWLIAYAMVHRASVVTHERHGQKGVKIPDIGDHFHVRCITIPEMLRELEIKLEWTPPAA